MSFGEGDLHARVEELERDNAILRSDCDVTRGRWTARGAEIARQRERIGELESLVRFMEPFFKAAVSNGCGCPDDYFEPHGCDDGCKALRELGERMDALGIEVDA